jgi:DNA polymerase III epsilon subunit-like protein
MNYIKDWHKEVVALSSQGLSGRKIAALLSKSKTQVNDVIKTYKQGNVSVPAKGAKVLLLDIETAPLRSYTWGLWQQNVGLNQIDGEWFILSAAAKWLGASENEIFYKDLRGVVDQEDDRAILDMMWKLINEADVVVGQNSKKFDAKKLNARFVMNGYQPPSPYKHIDTLQIAKAMFGFTSNKLEWMTDKLCVKYKKQKHNKFNGFELWKEMLNDNIEAWNECEVYNKYDVLSLEELYLKLAPWDKTHPNFNLFHDNNEHVCRCGSKSLVEDGFAYTAKSKFQQYRCLDCGATTRSSKNLFSKEKRESLQLNVLS